MKGKSIVILCAMLCTTLIAWGILFWPTLYRYDKSKGRPARINRVTGYTEILYSSGWKPTISEQDVTVIPYEEVAKIELKSKQINKEGIYNILIYNGSSWTITKLRLSIRKIDSEKPSEKTYETTLTNDGITPFSTGSCSIRLIDHTMSELLGHLLLEPKILEAWGYKGD